MLFHNGSWRPFLGFAAMLTGCGGQPDGATDSLNKTQTLGPTITIAYNRYFKMSFSDAPSPYDALRQQLADSGSKIQVEMRYLPDSAMGHRETLAVWLMSEDSEIDLYGMDAPWTPEFAEAGWATPLDDELTEAIANFEPAGLAPFTWAGRLYGAPFWSSVGGLYARVDILEELDLPIPKTFDEFVDTSKIATRAYPELTGFVWPGGKNEDLILTWSEVFLGHGGAFFDENGACQVNSEPGVQALAWMRQLIKDGVSPAACVGWTSEEARRRFVAGNALFLRNNQDLTRWLDDPERSAIVGNWEFVPNPSRDGVDPAAVTGGFAFALNPYSKRKTASIEILRLLSSLEMQRAFALAWGPVQFYKGIYEDPGLAQEIPSLDSLARVSRYAAPRPQSPNYARMSDILKTEIHSALTGQRSPEESMQRAANAIDALR